MIDYDKLDRIKAKEHFTLNPPEVRYCKESNLYSIVSDGAIVYDLLETRKIASAILSAHKKLGWDKEYFEIEHLLPVSEKPAL